MKWQPIETVPKDGTWILVSDGPDIGVAYWMVGVAYWMVVNKISRASLNAEKPVWWMPFPAAPLNGEEVEDEGGRGGSGMAPPDGTAEPTVLPDGDKGGRGGGCG